MGDLDGDGDDDLIAGMDVAGTSTDSVITIYKNTGQYTTANFNNPVTITLDSSSVDGDILDIASYDIDGDGFDDIVAGTQDNSLIILKSPGGSNTWIDSNWESASANWLLVEDNAGNDVFAIDVGNLAGSSDKDIIVGLDAKIGNDELKAYTHPGSNPFTSSWSSIASLVRNSAVDITDVTIGDMDDDGDNDVAYVISDTDTVGFSSNDGDDTFTHMGGNVECDTDENFNIVVLKAYDMDGDGDDDVVCFDGDNDANDEVRYLKSDGSWGWSAISVGSINFFNPKDAVVADFDDDGDGDVAVAGAWVAVKVQTVWMIENEGSDTFDDPFAESDFSITDTDKYTVNAIVEMDVGDDDNPWKDLVIAIDPDTAGSSLEIAIFQNAIPEFTTLLAPIVSVIGIVCWNYRRREAAGQ